MRTKTLVHNYRECGYESPTVEVIEVEIESIILAGSDMGGGTDI